MTWLAWRQFRFQAALAAFAVLGAGVFLVVLGNRIRDSHRHYFAQCPPEQECADLITQFTTQHHNLVLMLNGLLMLVPLLIGLFWGAPLVAREYETGTHALVWNQSITRRRWLLTKLLLGMLAAVVVTGLLSALLTWAATPLDRVVGDRFTGAVFGARDLVPVAYGMFGFVLGAVIGMMIRRTVAAMALTLLVFSLFLVAMPNLVRPHLMPPVEVSVPMTAQAIQEDTRGLGGLRNRPTVKGLQIPDAWVTSTSELLTPDGQPLDIDIFNECIFEPPERFPGGAECLAHHDLHVQASYQPNHRYWQFQWIESGLLVGLSGMLVGFSVWRIQRRLR